MPAILVLVVTLGLSMFAAIALNIPDLTGWLIGGGFILSFVLSWLWWSINITKWRLWAFDNVRNVHELKKRASREQLIWKDGNFFEKTEIRSAADKDKWAALQDKFNIPDVFIDDYTVPAETRVYYSKVMIVLGIAFGFACMGVSIYFFKQPDKTVYLGVVICIIGLVFAYQSVKKLSDKSAQITLNDKGIETSASGYHNWDTVQDEDVITERRGSIILVGKKTDHRNAWQRIGLMAG
jgi:hypothetical protein